AAVPTAPTARAGRGPCAPAPPPAPPSARCNRRGHHGRRPEKAGRGAAVAVTRAEGGGIGSLALAGAFGGGVGQRITVQRQQVLEDAVHGGILVSRAAGALLKWRQA